MKIAAIQMTSGDDIAANIAALAPLIASAVSQGARFIATPENTFYMRREGMAAMDDVPMENHIGIAYARGAAKQHGVWLLIGSIRAREVGMDKPFNRSVLIAPDGEIAATYDKIQPSGGWRKGGAGAGGGNEAWAKHLLRRALPDTLSDLVSPRGGYARSAFGLHAPDRGCALAHAAEGAGD
jgi:predicted amidohydrolase